MALVASSFCSAFLLLITSANCDLRQMLSSLAGISSGHVAKSRSQITYWHHSHHMLLDFSSSGHPSLAARVGCLVRFELRTCFLHPKCRVSLDFRTVCQNSVHRMTKLIHYWFAPNFFLLTADTVCVSLKPSSIQYVFRE